MASRALSGPDIEKRIQITPIVREHYNALIELISLTRDKYNSEIWNNYDYTDRAIDDSLRNFTDSEWQWEFTRRNEIYRRLWIANKLGLKGTISPTVWKISENIFGNIYLTDPNIGALDIHEKAKRWKPDSGDIFPPDFDSHVLFKRNYRHERIIYSNETEKSLKFTNETQFYFRFDRELNIGDQIADLKVHWNLAQKRKSTRQRQETWPEYLRAWDASADGLSYSKIALLLRKEQNEQSARDSVMSARDLVRRCATVF